MAALVAALFAAFAFLIMTAFLAAMAAFELLLAFFRTLAFLATTALFTAGILLDASARLVTVETCPVMSFLALETLVVLMGRHISMNFSLLALVFTMMSAVIMESYH